MKKIRQYKAEHFFSPDFPFTILHRINRAEEFFASPDGKALLRKWGLPERLEGVGFCILGYADKEPAPAAPRREGRVVRM